MVACRNKSIHNSPTFFSNERCTKTFIGNLSSVEHTESTMTV